MVVSSTGRCIPRALYRQGLLLLPLIQRGTLPRLSSCANALTTLNFLIL